MNLSSGNESAAVCDPQRLPVRSPFWLKGALPGEESLESMRRLSEAGIATVCTEAQCPNRADCGKANAVTFMILGAQCTRNCAFCAVDKAKRNPLRLDTDEPQKIAQAVAQRGMEYVVVTSVSRDDLPDKGAGQFARTIAAVTGRNPGVLVEVLIPDFSGERVLLETVCAQKPDVIGHNLETVRSLYPKIRPEADYARSLRVLKNVKAIDARIVTKSSLMLGLAETPVEVMQAMDDLRAVDCDILTFGQYLAPSRQHAAVKEYIHPQTFAYYRSEAFKRGFKAVLSAPLARSSYKAREIFKEAESCLT